MSSRSLTAVAATYDGEPCWHFTIDGWVPGTTEWPSMQASLESILQQHGSITHTSIALLPPLLWTRRIVLPASIKRWEVRKVLSLNAGRYFPIADGDPVVVARSAGIDSEGRAWLVSAVDSNLLSSVEAVVNRSGLRLLHVVPYWLSVERGIRLSGRKARLPERVVVPDVPAHHIIELRKRRVVNVRATLPDLIGSDPDEHTDLSQVTVASSVSAESDEQAGDPHDVGGRLPEASRPFHRTIARHGCFCGGLTLQSRAEAAIAVAAMRRSLARRAGAVVLLLLSSLATTAVGSVMELRKLRAERAAHLPSVVAAAAYAARMDSVVADARRVLTVRNTGAQWSGIIAAIATRMPGDSRLERLRAYGDTLILHGQAPDPHAVTDALKSEPHVADWELMTPEQPATDEFVRPFILRLVLAKPNAAR